MQIQIQLTITVRNVIGIISYSKNTLNTKGRFGVNKVIKLIKAVLNLASGYLLIPITDLGFVLATNSLKGWGVRDDDGELFVPLGIVLLIISIAIIVTCIVRLIFAIKKKNGKDYLFVGLHFLGIIIFLICWGIDAIL